MASLKSGFKLCTFDVTNTLLKFKISIGEQYAKVGHIYGVEREPIQLTVAFSEHWKKMNSTYPNFGCDIGLTSHAWWRKIIEKTFYMEGKELSGKQIDSISNHLFEIYRKNVCWEVVPGAFPLLENLKKKSMVLGVISNFDDRLESVLHANHLNSYFDFVLASYVVHVAKPSRKIFDLALHKASNVSASDALHIGDNIELDYQAAKEAGWNAILIHDKSKGILPEDIQTQDVIEDIAELESHILGTE